MAKALVFKEPGIIGFEEEAERALAAAEIRVRTLYSGISAGTELTAYHGSNPYLHKKWDGERRLFVAADSPSLAYPLTGWGYEEIGEVVEVGAAVENVNVGDKIYGAWGHRTYHILDEAYAAARIFPEALDPILGIFSHFGSVALNGIHDANIHIGETVAVFGLGALGQTVMQLQVDGLLTLRPLITHVEPFENAAILFEALDETPEQIIQAVLEFPTP